MASHGVSGIAAKSSNIASASPTNYAFFSRSGYYMWWFGLLLLHCVGIAFFAFVATGYWLLPGTYLDSCLSFYSLGMSAEKHHTLAKVHLVIAVCHAIFALWMIGWSVRRSALVFGSGNNWRAAVNSSEHHRTASRSRNSSDGDEDLPTSTSSRKVVEASKYAILFVWDTYNALFGRRGFFGVDNPRFDMLLALRELIETTLQTVQAYRMSLFLPRVWLNRFYVALLVLNCWSTALVHHLYHDSPAERRVLAILCDCILDATTAICIPLILVLDYIEDYNFAIEGFDTQLWSEDVWFVNALNEFQLIFIGSWGNLATRALFSFGMISSMNSIKNLVRPKSSRVQSFQSNEPLDKPVVSFVSMLPGSTESRAASEPSLPKVPSKPILRSTSILMVPISLGVERMVLTRGFSALFLLWGFAIVALHTHAGLNPSLAQCKLQVRPWFVAAPACSLVELNCYNTGINGSIDNVEALWSEFEARAVVRVVMKHCAHLEIPSTLQKLYNLNGMKFYNSSIASWGESAALTNTFHPKIMSVLFVRVNFSEGELPLGLQASDFPRLLSDLEFCVTNLETLPDDLDLKWPKYGTVYLELGTMTVVPGVLARLAPFYLSFAGSPIEELSAAIFESDGIYYLNAGGTKISSLPQNVTHVGSCLSYVVLQDTNVSLYWSWLDEMFEYSTISRVYAAETPYCARRKQFLQSPSEGIADPDLGLTQTAQVSRLMNFSDPSNLDFSQKKVSCRESAATIYPIEFEDAYSGMKAVSADT